MKFLTKFVTYVYVLRNANLDWTFRSESLWERRSIQLSFYQRIRKKTSLSYVAYRDETKRNSSSIVSEKHNLREFKLIGLKIATLSTLKQVQQHLFCR